MQTVTLECIVREGSYGYYGLRVADGLVVGQIAPCSSVWVDGDPTDELLNGASALDLVRMGVEKAIKASAIYAGDQVAILGSDLVTYGEDAGEIIMRDAVVLKVWDR